MKQLQINKAYKALTKLMGLQLPVGEAYKIFMLAKYLEPTYSFEADREQQAVKKNNGTVANDGSIFFPSKEDEENFRNEMSEINNMDIDLSFDVVTLGFESLGDQKISPYEILCLDGFVTFV